MEIRGNHARYHPEREMNSGDFVHSFEDLSEQRIAISTALGSIFTPLMEEAHRKLVVNREGKGLILPIELPGTDPKSDASSDFLFLSMKFKDFEGLRFIKAFDFFQYYHRESVGASIPSAFDIRHPVGPFGETFAISMINTMRALYKVIPEELSEESDDSIKRHKLIIEKFTHFQDPKFTIADSLKSTGEAFTFLTNDRIVPGYESNPVGLFRKLIETGAFVELSKILSFSDLAFLTRNGYSPVGILNHETLTLNPEVKKLFLKRRNEKAAVSKNNKRTFKGCPLGYENTPTVDKHGNYQVIKESGVELGARIFVEYLDHYYNKALKANSKA